MIYDTSYSLAANTESFWHKLVKKKQQDLSCSVSSNPADI